MTAEQLEELLGKVTQGEWVSTEGDNTLSVVVKVSGIAEAMAIRKLMTSAPSLARRVIAGEKMANALEILGTTACFGRGDALGKRLSGSTIGREILSRMLFAQDALTAYREAIK